MIKVTFQEALMIGTNHERTRRIRIQKYLKESCYHRIECPVANFLVTFMWTRPLNNVALATATHRTPKRVSYETDT